MFSGEAIILPAMREKGEEAARRTMLSPGGSIFSWREKRWDANPPPPERHSHFQRKCPKGLGCFPTSKCMKSALSAHMHRLRALYQIWYNASYTDANVIPTFQKEAHNINKNSQKSRYNIFAVLSTVTQPSCRSRYNQVKFTAARTGA